MATAREQLLSLAMIAGRLRTDVASVIVAIEDAGIQARAVLDNAPFYEASVVALIGQKLARHTPTATGGIGQAVLLSRGVARGSRMA